MAKVVQNARQESGSRDRASHNDDVEVGCNLFRCRCGAFGVKDVMCEISTVCLEPETATKIII